MDTKMKTLQGTRLVPDSIWSKLERMWMIPIGMATRTKELQTYCCYFQHAGICNWRKCVDFVLEQMQSTRLKQMKSAQSHTDVILWGALEKVLSPSNFKTFPNPLSPCSSSLLAQIQKQIHTNTKIHTKKIQFFSLFLLPSYTNTKKQINTITKIHKTTKTKPSPIPISPYLHKHKYKWKSKNF